MVKEEVMFAVKRIEEAGRWEQIDPTIFSCKKIFSAVKLFLLLVDHFFLGIERDITMSHWHNSILGGGIPSTRSSPRLVGNEIFLTHWPNLWSIIFNKCMLSYSYLRPYLGRGAYPQKKVLFVSLTTRYFWIIDPSIFRWTKIFRTVKIFLLLVDQFFSGKERDITLSLWLNPGRGYTLNEKFSSSRWQRDIFDSLTQSMLYDL